MESKVEFKEGKPIVRVRLEGADEWLAKIDGDGAISVNQRLTTPDLRRAVTTLLGHMRWMAARQSGQTDQIRPKPGAPMDRGAIAHADREAQGPLSATNGRA